MWRKIAFAVALAGMSQLVHAQATDFEDLSLGTTYAAGSSFDSNGLSFDVVGFGLTASPIVVDDNLMAKGSGLELALPNTIGLRFQLPPQTNSISLKYASACCDTGVVVNGVASPLSGGLSPLDNTTLGGVSVGVTWAFQGTEMGTATFSGPISSFVIGGTELWIDDVQVSVPEPSSCALAGMCILPLLWRHRGRSLPG
jgi:hypothetical protein